MTKASSISTHASDSEDDINLFALLDTFLDAKWLIAGIAGAVTVVGAAYAILSAPVYQSNLLVQVEQNNGMAGNMLGELGSLFEGQSSAAAEMEILRSRMVVGQAVDQLQLHVDATPKYIPLIGPWLSKRATELSQPGFLGMSGYVSGTERIQLDQFAIPASLEGKEFTLVTTEQGFELNSPDGDTLAQGAVGEPVDFIIEGQTGQIKIRSLDALPGAQFSLVRNSEQEVLSDLQKELQIGERGRQSGIISVSLENTDPALLASTLQAIGNAYVQQNTERKAAEAEKTLTFLDSFLPELRQQMQVSEDDYTRFRDKNKTFDLSAEGKAALETTVELQVKLLELQQKRRELTPQYTSAHPAIKTIDQQIGALKKEIQRLENNARRMPDLEQQLLSLTRNVKVNSELYVNLLNSAQQLRLVKEGKVGNVRVIDNAFVPEKPVKPKKALVVAAALAIGLFLGMGIALLRKFLHAGLTEPNDIEQHLGMTVFATVPRSPDQLKLYQDINKKKPGTHILADQKPKDLSVESLRSLRTALQFAMLSAKNNIILISGATPGIGKSFISVNFAYTLAASDKRVLLIDSDLRKGYMNHYFGLPRNNGFSELISGTISREQAIHKNAAPGLDFISTGELPPNPAELLLNPRSQELLNSLAQDYDFVVVDSAPILAVSDTLALVGQAGTTFLVARSGVTTLGELEETEKRIQRAGAESNGVIFNDAVIRSRRYGSKYGQYQYRNYDYQSENV